jgi:hypothetical protein
MNLKCLLFAPIFMPLLFVPTIYLHPSIVIDNNIILNVILLYIFMTVSRDSSVGIATGYGLDGGGVGFQVPAGSRIISSPSVVHTGSGVHPTSYPMGRGCTFPGGKAAGA